LVTVQIASRAYLIYIIGLLPVETVSLLLVLEEAVVLIDDAPQGLEVALRGVGVGFLIDAGAQQEGYVS
jgi:hypothetical protein